MAHLEAVGGSWVLTNNPPGEASPLEHRTWYHKSNAIIYAALLEAVRDTPVLASEVRGVAEFGNSARLAWDEIHRHFLKTSELTEDSLKSKLISTVPGKTESMRSFLTRLDDLWREFEAHGFEPKEVDFVTQALRALTLPWRNALGELGRRPNRDIPWVACKEELQNEDNRRRISNLSGPDALLPLGWTKKEGGHLHYAAGESGTAAAASTGPAKGKGPGKFKGGGKQERKAGDLDLLVCFCCLKTGHGADKCRNKPANWVLTPEQKAKAMEIRKQRIAQSQKDKASAAAARQVSPRCPLLALGPRALGPNRDVATPCLLATHGVGCGCTTAGVPITLPQTWETSTHYVSPP